MIISQPISVYVGYRDVRCFTTPMCTYMVRTYILSALGRISVGSQRKTVLSADCAYRLHYSEAGDTPDPVSPAAGPFRLRRGPANLSRISLVSSVSSDLGRISVKSQPKTVSSADCAYDLGTISVYVGYRDVRCLPPLCVHIW